MRALKRAVAVCALLLGGVTGWASGADAALPCAEWISTGQNDPAGVGHLIGTETVTYTIEVTPLGVGGTITTVFEVGTYEFDGEAIVVDCRTYTRFR